MTGTVLEEIRVGYRRTHRTLLDVARAASAETFARPFGTANSIAFNLWHVARWDDSLFPSAGRAIPALAPTLGRPDQLWVREKIGQRWGLPDELGGGGAGTGLPTDAAHGLVLPARDELVSYAERVFAEFSERLVQIDDAMLARRVPPKNERSVGGWLLSYWEHAARHLGMIEALRGVLGEVGSARG